MWGNVNSVCEIVCFFLLLGMFCKNSVIVWIIYFSMLDKINKVKRIDKIGLSMG